MTVSPFAIAVISIACIVIAIILAAARSQELRNQGATLSACDYVVRISSPDSASLIRAEDRVTT